MHAGQHGCKNIQSTGVQTPLSPSFKCNENLRSIYEKIRETLCRKNTGNPRVRKSAR